MAGLKGMGKTYKTTAAILIVLFCMFMLLFAAWLTLLMSEPGGSQRGVFLVDPDDWFMDWFNVVYYSVGKRPYAWGLIEERSLPPLTFLLLYPFSRLYAYDISGWIEGESRYEARYSQLPIVAAVMIFIVSYLLLFYALSRNSRLKSDYMKIILFTVLFLSGINLFCIERGNLQVITAAAVFFYIYIFDREEAPGRVMCFTGCACLAFAAAIKLFPAMMGVILLYKRRWKEAFLSFILGGALFFLPFLWMDQPFFEALGRFFTALREHAESYMTVADFGFSVPVIISLTGMSHGALQIIAYIAAALSLGLAWLWGSSWKRMMLLSLTLVLTSGQQGYYCLMFLFLPMVLFFNEEHTVTDAVYAIIFAVVLSPLQRTIYIDGVAVSSKAIINFTLLALYLTLLTQTCILGYRRILKKKECADNARPEQQ